MMKKLGAAWLTRLAKMHGGMENIPVTEKLLRGLFMSKASPNLPEGSSLIRYIKAGLDGRPNLTARRAALKQIKDEYGEISRELRQSPVPAPLTPVQLQLLKENPTLGSLLKFLKKSQITGQISQSSGIDYNRFARGLEQARTNLYGPASTEAELIKRMVPREYSPVKWEEFVRDIGSKGPNFFKGGQFSPSEWNIRRPGWVSPRLDVAKGYADGRSNSFGSATTPYNFHWAPMSSSKAFSSGKTFTTRHVANPNRRARLDSLKIDHRLAGRSSLGEVQDYEAVLPGHEMKSLPWNHAWVNGDLVFKKELPSSIASRVKDLRIADGYLLSEPHQEFADRLDSLINRSGIKRSIPATHPVVTLNW